MKSNTSNDLARRAGLELGEDGHPVGRDPRKMTPTELKRAGHFPKPVLRVVRDHCIECCAGQLGEVRKCVAVSCSNWPYRLGTNPWLRPTMAQRRQRAVALERAAEEKNVRAAGPKFSETGPGIDDYPAPASARKSDPKPPADGKEAPVARPARPA